MALPLVLLSIGGKLLGVGKFLGNFVKQNWKWVLPIAIIIAGYFYVSNKIDNAYDQGYEIGVQDEIDKQQQRIDIENRKNREFEALLTTVVTNFGKEIARETAERVVKESEITTRVERIIKENPIYQQCVVDPEIVEARNEIRRLGPPGPVVTVRLNDE